MSKIVIVVSGGCVRSVYARDTGLEVELLDFDDVDNDPEREEALEAKLADVTAKMHVVF